MSPCDCMSLWNLNKFYKKTIQGGFKLMKKITVIIAMMLVVALAVPTFGASFSDVPSNHWAYDAINKLVASGVITGYPDGTFRGSEEMTRYEMAVMVSRALENIAAEQADLAEDVDQLASGLTTGQAQDVTAIVKALMEKNAPEAVVVPEGLTETQAEEVANLIEALTFEFKAELKVLGAKTDAIAEDVDALEGRVTALETETPAVGFSGTYAVDFVDQAVTNSGNVVADEDYYYFPVDSAATNADADTDGKIIKSEGGSAKLVTEDPIVYADPWDDDSDEIAADEDGGSVEQTLDMALNISSGGLTSVITLDVSDDEDEFEIDSAALTLENDFLMASYNEANEVTIADYAFSAAEFNGVNVELKEYGVDVFAGTAGYDVGAVDTEAIDATSYNMQDNEYDYVRYDWDSKLDETVGNDNDVADQKNEFKPQTKDSDFYVYGAKKSFAVSGLDLTAKFAGLSELDNTPNSAEETYYLGVDGSTTVEGADLTFDVASNIPEVGDNGVLARFGVAKETDFAGFEFNYKNRNENFMPLSEDDVVFDSGDDDYDEFTTGLGETDMSGFNLTVTPKLFADVTTTVFYGDVAYNSKTSTTPDANKVKVSAETGMFAEGLTVSGSYAIEDNDDAAKKMNTLETDAEYTVNEFVTASAGYKLVKNNKFASADDDKSVVNVGLDVVDYPVWTNLVARAGVNYEEAGADYEETTTEYNAGLGYTMGRAQFDYDYTFKEVAGDDADNYGTATVEEGKYDTHKLGMVYSITEATDLTASYEILNLDLAAGETLNGASGDYEVKTAKAGVAVSF